MLRSVRVNNHFSDTLNFCPFNFRKIRVNSIDLGGTETEGAYALGVMGSEFEKRIVSQTTRSIWAARRWRLLVSNRLTVE
jgi:hypothetical protein